MTTVNTVLGPIDANELGFTLSHEHCIHMRFYRYLPFLYDVETSIANDLIALKAAKAAGVQSYIECSTANNGREVTLMRQVSEASGIQIVCCTGLTLDIPKLFWDKDPDWIARFMFHEIEHGIDDTGIKPGVIKVANDVEGVTPQSEKVLRAAARVAKETGVPITTHTWAPAEVGRRQVEIFLDEGVPMRLVAIGHSADTTDVKYLEDLLNTGCYLSMDRYPSQPGRPTSSERNKTVKALIDRGWGTRLMLGHDYGPQAILRGVNRGLEPLPPLSTHLPTVAIPNLLKDGVTQAQVDTMMIEVPKRFLTGDAMLPRDSELQNRRRANDG